MRTSIILIAVSLLLAASPALAGQRITTDDISLLNRYYYRLVNRAAAVDPGKRHSGNFKPLSIRESVNLFAGREPLDAMEDSAARYYDVKEVEKQPGNFVFQPLKEMHFFGAYTDKEDAPLYGRLGPHVDGNYYGALIGSGNAYVGDWLVGGYSLRISNDDLDGPVDFFGYKLKTGFRHVSLSAAKESVVVGPGFFGNLLVSDNVAPENSVILKTEVPYDWGFLGAFRWYVWHTWYDDDERVNKDPRLLGARLSLMPWDVLEIGFTRTAMYGGSENGSFDSLEAYWEMFTAENENVGGSDYNSQQAASFDVTLYLPALNGLGPLAGGKIYIDYAFTDIKGFWQSNSDDNTIFEPLHKSWLVGLLLTTGKTDLTAEYVDTSYAAYGGGGGGFQMGYSDNGYIIGHYAGNRTVGFIGEVYHEWRPSFHTYLGGNYFDHQSRTLAGEEEASPHQIETGIFGGVRLMLGKDLEMDVRCQYSEYSRTDVSDSPARYELIDGEDFNTTVYVTLDYHF